MAGESATTMAEPREEISSLPPPPPAPPPRCWSLKPDCEKYYRIILGTKSPSLPRKVAVWIWKFELPCIAIYRFGQLCMVLMGKSRILGALPFLVFLVFDYFMRLILHVELPYKARIGPAFHMSHPFTIIVGPTTIGANCNVGQNVTIGMGFGTAGPGIPVIGNNVWIGPGATLTGPITIGDGTTVAAGAVVSRSMPAHSLVVGNPARAVQQDYDNSSFLGYEMPKT
jgi:serine O-acetyltransferase